MKFNVDDSLTIRFKGDKANDITIEHFNLDRAYTEGYLGIKLPPQKIALLEGGDGDDLLLGGKGTDFIQGGTGICIFV
ncbi:hypothetical protein AGMMS50243_24450 [Betaproteobacteria bacterium]|nr:hypothetical protein AGMMS50243_24450 [Betaproteobacteria bacterium]